MASTLTDLGIKEPSIADAKTYNKHVHRLALVYAGLFLISIAGDIVLVLQGKLFVTLAQRSNVETLTLAFFFIFFSYVGALSAAGAWGGLKLLYATFAGSADKREGRKIALLKKKQIEVTAAVNLLIEREDAPHQPFDIPIEDGHGAIGTLRFDGARITHLDPFFDGSNTLFNFVVQQIRDIVGNRGNAQRLDIVEWKKIDDEETEKYLCSVEFARNLERHLGATDLWPRVRLKDSEIRQLERRLSEVCPTLRSEALLPDWEYEGEHKIPIIPEPLGIISLQRNEKRVDPLASMGSALVVLGISLAILIVMVFFPPWVPGM